MSGTTIEVLSAEYKSLKLIRWTKKKSSSSSLPWMICAPFIYYCTMKKAWHSVQFLNIQYFDFQYKDVTVCVLALDVRGLGIEALKLIMWTEKHCRPRNLCHLYVIKKAWHSVELFWNIWDHWYRVYWYNSCFKVREIPGLNPLKHGLCYYSQLEHKSSQVQIPDNSFRIDEKLVWSYFWFTNDMA